MSIKKELFGTTKDGESVFCYTLSNTRGVSAEILSYGARIRSILVPDKDGKIRDVCLGYDTLSQYEDDHQHFGAVVGRFANRIEKGQFTLNGKTYTLAINNGPNHLHGGIRGFHFYNWDAKEDDTSNSVCFTHFSPDGDEGYPGNLTMSITYTLDDDNVLTLDYTATTDAYTVFNTTNHSYFNLSGDDADTVLDHELTVNADFFAEADKDALANGVISKVENTPFDFRTPKTIGADLPSDHPQLEYTKAYDHNFVLRGSGLRKVASLISPVSGIRMDCETDQPGVQIFVPTKVTSDSGKGGKTYPAYGSVCLETQHFPNAPCLSHFPSSVIKAGETFKTTTKYTFSVEKDAE